MHLAQVLIPAVDVPFEPAIDFFEARNFVMEVLVLFQDSAVLRGLCAALFLLELGKQTSFYRHIGSAATATQELFPFAIGRGRGVIMLDCRDLPARRVQVPL